MLCEAMLPIILCHTGTSKDPSGKTVLNLWPYQTVTAWAPLRDNEQAELDHINEVCSHDKEGKEPLNWLNFLLNLKDAGLHPDVSRLKWEEKEGDLKQGDLMSHIANDWDQHNMVEKSSSQLLKTDDVIQHYWEGDLKPLVYRTGGTHDQEAEVVLPNPPPLEQPCKFLIYVQYKLH
ncbi:hypothetical protein FRC10_009727 [Ceratobasidium sp. 414]|nr:hypothetical protein FRC10_009727 [Ceratobasidium sp. 414]